MNGVINVDVESLRIFIAALRKFNGDLEAGWGQLDSRWRALSDTWNDQKIAEFTDAVGWEDVRRRMRGYLDLSDTYLHFLQRLEEAGTSWHDVH